MVFSTCAEVVAHDTDETIDASADEVDIVAEVEVIVMVEVVVVIAVLLLLVAELELVLVAVAWVKLDVLTSWRICCSRCSRVVTPVPDNSLID